MFEFLLPSHSPIWTSNFYRDKTICDRVMISSSFGVGQHMGVIIGGYRQNLDGRRSGCGTGIYVEYDDEVAIRSELKEDLRRNM